RLGQKIIHASLPRNGRCGERVVAGNHHGANAHGAEVSEALEHSTLDDVGQRDHAQHPPVLGNQKRSAAPIGDVCNALLSFFGDLLAAFGNVFGDCVGRAFADLPSVEVDSRHPRLRGKRNEHRIVRSKIASAQSVFFFCQHNNRAAFGGFVGEGRKLGGVSEVCFVHIGAREKHRGFAIAQRDGAGFVQQKHVYVPGCFHSAAGHGDNISLNHAVHAGDSDGG